MSKEKQIIEDLQILVQELQNKISILEYEIAILKEEKQLTLDIWGWQ